MALQGFEFVKAGIQQRPIEDPIVRASIAVWNAMGGEIHWEAFDMLLALMCVEPEDVEHVIRGVIAVRDHQREMADQEV